MFKKEIKTFKGLEFAFKSVLAKAQDIKTLLEDGKVFEFILEEVNLKSREQEKKYHAMLGDIAVQATHLNQFWDLDDWKRLTVDMFAKECRRLPTNDRLRGYWMKNQFKVVPALDGKGMVWLGAQTKLFPQYVANAFIEFLYQYGADNDIEWSDPKDQWHKREAV